MNTQCKLCARGVSDLTGYSNREAARHYGVAASSVQRHKRHLDSDPALSEFLESFDVDPASVVPKAVSYRDADSGSWIKYRVDEDPNLLSYDDLDFTTPITLPSDIGQTDEADVLVATDWQIGKAQESGGGTPETMHRIRTGLAKFVRRLETWRPKSAVLVDGGDIIENLFNTPSQPFTNDLDLTAQIRTARRLRWECIKTLAPLVETLYVGTVPSNHGAVRVGKQAQAGSSEADFGLDIHCSLEERVEDIPDLANVKFFRPEQYEDTATLTVAGTKLAFNHGHNSGNIDKHSEWWAKQDHGRLPGWDADVFTLAHFHNHRVRQSGAGRWLINAASPDPGSGWFTKKSGENATAGQTAYRVCEGDISDISIL